MSDENKDVIASDVPETEKNLKKLQELYLSNPGDQKIFEEFFFLIRKYARSLTLKTIKKKNIFLPPERVDEICTDATLNFLSNYNKKGWIVDKSFAGVLRFSIIVAMWGKEYKDEMNSSLNLTFSEDKDSKEIVDIIGSGALLPWDMSKYGKEKISDDPQDTIMENLNVSFDEIKSLLEEVYLDLPYRVYMRFVPWLVLQFRKPKTKNIQSLFSKLFLTNKEENVFDMLWLEVHNRISQHVI